MIQGSVRHDRYKDRKMVAAFHTGPVRGADLILEHCAALDRWEMQRTPAVERLERELGPLARLLLFALAGAQSRRSSSSP